MFFLRGIRRTNLPGGQIAGEVDVEDHGERREDHDKGPEGNGESTAVSKDEESHHGAASLPESPTGAGESPGAMGEASVGQDGKIRGGEEAEEAAPRWPGEDSHVGSDAVGLQRVFFGGEFLIFP